MGVGEVISAQFSLAIRQNLMGCYQVQKLELPLVGSNSDTDFFFFFFFTLLWPGLIPFPWVKIYYSL